ncbi:MAG: 3-hydroxyacyl-ACP dehydratase FabZ family protein [Candidatus Methylomirabilis sp.]
MRYYLVDLITDWEVEHTIRGIKNVAMTEDFLEYHFPKNPVMPGVLLLESMAQLAGWLEAVSSDFTRWILLEHVSQCKFYGVVRPGDQVEFAVGVRQAEDPGRRAYEGVGSVAGQRRVVAEFDGKIMPLSEIEHPGDQKSLFQILTRGASDSLPFKGATSGS